MATGHILDTHLITILMYFISGHTQLCPGLILNMCSRMAVLRICNLNKDTSYTKQMPCSQYYISCTSYTFLSCGAYQSHTLVAEFVHTWLQCTRNCTLKITHSRAAGMLDGASDRIHSLMPARHSTWAIPRPLINTYSHILKYPIQSRKEENNFLISPQIRPSKCKLLSGGDERIWLMKLKFHLPTQPIF